MEGTLVVKNLMNKKTEIQSSDIDILNSKIQVFRALNMGDAMVETSRSMICRTTKAP